MSAAIVKANTSAELAPLDDRTLLEAVLARDETAWRELVRRFDEPLHEAVRAATDAIWPLARDQIDDVLGELWLRLLDDDMRRLRALDSSRASALLVWLTMQVAHVAYEYLRRLGAQPPMVSLHAARNVAVPASTSIDSAIRDAVREVVREEVRAAISELLPAAPAKSSVSSEYLSIDEAAKVARLHHTTIRAWIKDGSLTAFRAGRVYRIRRADLDARLTMQAADATAVAVEERATAILTKRARRRPVDRGTRV
jgi:excisionase family DNA binding protein